MTMSYFIIMISKYILGEIFGLNSVDPLSTLLFIASTKDEVEEHGDLGDPIAEHLPTSERE